MEVIIQRNPSDVCRLAAKMVAQLVRRNPKAVLGLATGGTQQLMYTELVRMHRQEKLDFRQVTTFNLDEYVGLGPSHPCSYHRFMRDNFFDHVRIPARKIHLPDGLTKNIP